MIGNSDIFVAYMDALFLAHLIGCFGELLNLVGAVVFAIDLVGRDLEHKLEEGLKATSRLAVAFDLQSTTYKGRRASSMNFARDVLNRRSALLGYWGLGTLGVGFIFLIAYHCIEMIYAP